MQEQYEKFNKEIEAISNRNRNSKAEEYNERTKKIQQRASKAYSIMQRKKSENSRIGHLKLAS